MLFGRKRFDDLERELDNQKVLSDVRLAGLYRDAQKNEKAYKTLKKHYDELKDDYNKSLYANYSLGEEYNKLIKYYNNLVIGFNQQSEDLNTLEKELSQKDHLIEKVVEEKDTEIKILKSFINHLIDRGCDFEGISSIILEHDDKVIFEREFCDND